MVPIIFLKHIIDEKRLRRKQSFSNPSLPSSQQLDVLNTESLETRYRKEAE